MEKNKVYHMEHPSTIKGIGAYIDIEYGTHILVETWLLSIYTFFAHKKRLKIERLTIHNN